MQEPTRVEPSDRRCSVCGAALPGCTCSPEGLHHNGAASTGSEPVLDAPARELEEALGSLALSPTGIPAESLWYRAGFVRERRRANRWRAAAAIAIVAAGAAMFWRPNPATVTVDHVVVVREQARPPVGPAGPTPPAAPAESALAAESDASGDEVASAGYLRLRDKVLRDGLHDLPVSAGGGVPADAALRPWPLPDQVPGTLAWPKSAAFNLRGG